MEYSKNENLSNISNLLNSLEEVESYIITDMDGRIHMASSDNYNENMINSSIYLWIIGTQLGSEFNMGEPANLIHHLKTRKRLIQKYNEYLIILNLMDITKFPVFKSKLYELINKEM